MASDKKDKKSKRDKDEHKSKKRNRDIEAQIEEEPRHKRSKSEAPQDGPAAEITEASPDQTTTADATDKSGKARRSEKRKQKKRQSLGVEADEANADVSMTDVTAINGVADEVALEVADADADAEAVSEKKKKKGKDRKKHQDKEDSEPVEGTIEASARESNAPVEDHEVTDDDEKKRRKKEKKEKRRKDKDANSTEQVIQNDADVMEIDNSTKASDKPFGKLPEQPYPFFTQQVSQYLPLYPLGMIDPIDGYADQHLKPLLNHYVPAFEGVLLGYHDVRIGEAPGKGSLTEKSEDSDEAVLESIDEYAVSFGWLTAKLDLFKPSRGAWMEGSVNMQTEGHLGVVCWGMFNASIEAGRLPKGWRWHSLLSNPKSKKSAEEAKLPTPEPAADDDEHDDATQLHTTGYWVDDNNQRVKGSIRFQIKNFEVGVSGDYGYLSIEGTMLDSEAEKQKSADELEKLRRWKLRNGASRREQKRLPDFAMTKFGMDEEEELENESKRAEVWKGSRPASETAE